MKSADYHIFGIGVGSDDLRYIGWTEKSIDEDQAKQEVLCDLVESGRLDLSGCVVQALRGDNRVHGDEVSIFEIESVSSENDALSSVMFWRTYYRALGLEVLVDN